MLEKRKEFLQKCLQTDYKKGLELFSKEELVSDMLELLKDELNHLDMKRDYTYLLKIIPYLYESAYFEQEKKIQVLNQLQEIRTQIKNKLQNNHLLNQTNHEVMKKLIGKIEILYLSISDNNKNTKLELFRYLVFSIKNLSVLKRILVKDASQINMSEEKGILFAEEVFDKFLEVLKNHVEDKFYSGLDDVLYYDRVLKELFSLNQKNMTPAIKKVWTDKIQKAKNCSFCSLERKERYFYFLYKWESYLEEINNENCLAEKKERLLYEYQIQPHFSFASEIETKMIIKNANVPKSSSYIPKIYTVDGEGAEELDDGFSCQKENGLYKLGVHITNPILYLDEKGMIFEEATKRASSIYIKNFIPMFPKELATGLFSLNEGNIRMVTSLYTTIDLEKKQIKKFETIFEPVYVSLNDTYSSCNYTMMMEVGEKEYVETLVNLKKILPFLNEQYCIDEVYRKMNRSELNISSTNVIGNSSSEKLVEALMIFTNHRYAEYCLNNHIPCLFRNHEMTPFYKADLEAYRNLLKMEEKNSPMLNETSILESNYPRSFYGIKNIGHFGLGISSYTHFTSPDRRIPDCYNALMLKKYLEGTLSSTYERELQKLSQIADFINDRNNSLRLFMKEYSYQRN